MPSSFLSSYVVTGWSNTFLARLMTQVGHWTWFARVTTCHHLSSMSLTSSLLRPQTTYVTSFPQTMEVFRPRYLRGRSACVCPLWRTTVVSARRWRSCEVINDDTVGALLDRQIPFKSVICRRRSSNEWYDDTCRSAKSNLRSLERAAHRAGPRSDTTLPAVIAWRTERRRYFDMVQQKRSEYWTSRIDSERLQPYRLWKSFDQILDVAKLRRSATSMRRSCIISLTNKLLAFVMPPLLCHRHKSELLLSAVSSGVFNWSCHTIRHCGYGPGVTWQPVLIRPSADMAAKDLH